LTGITHQARISLPRDGSIESVHPAETRGPARFPLFSARIPAGFPSPADDYIDRGLDLNELLVRHPAATFFVRVSGDSMVGAGIRSGDVLVVDRAVAPRSRSIIIAAVAGELAVKRLIRENGKIYLASENPDYAPLEVTEGIEFEVWGVVVHVIHSFK
jgi:DNA polymerase V